MCLDVPSTWTSGPRPGGGAYESLRFYRDISDPINPINNAQTVDMRDRSGKYRLINVRAAAYWKLRECLDPVHGENLALPPDSELLADLCAPRYKLTASGINPKYATPHNNLGN